MPVSPFYRLSHANCRVSLKRKVSAQQDVTTPGRKNLDSAKTAAPRTRIRLQSQMECLLEEMRIKLSSVVTDLLGRVSVASSSASGSAQSAAPHLEQSSRSPRQRTAVAPAAPHL